MFLGISLGEMKAFSSRTLWLLTGENRFLGQVMSQSYGSKAGDFIKSNYKSCALFSCSSSHRANDIHLSFSLLMILVYTHTDACPPPNASILFLHQHDLTSQGGLCVSSAEHPVHVHANTCAPSMWLLKLNYSSSLFLKKISHSI